MLAITFLAEAVVFIYVQPVWRSNYLLQSCTWVLKSVSLLNCALSLIRISAGFTFSVVSNLTIMCCTTTKGTTCSLIVITTDKKQADMQQYSIMVIGILPPNSSKVTLFYMRISALEEQSLIYI
jgi:hypothetical protein